MYFNTYGLQIEKIELSKYNNDIIHNFNENAFSWSNHDLTNSKKKMVYNGFKKKFRVIEEYDENNQKKTNKNKLTKNLDRVYLHQKAIEKSYLSNLA